MGRTRPARGTRALPVPPTPIAGNRRPGAGRRTEASARTASQARGLYLSYAGQLRHPGGAPVRRREHQSRCPPTASRPIAPMAETSSTAGRRAALTASVRCRAASARIAVRSTAPRPTASYASRCDRKQRGGKTVTVVTGLPADAETLAEIAGALKRLCGSGGTVKDGTIEVQGDHRDRIAQALQSRGFTVKLAGG